MRADTVHSLLLLRDTPWETAMQIIILYLNPLRCSRESELFTKHALFPSPTEITRRTYIAQFVKKKKNQRSRPRTRLFSRILESRFLPISANHEGLVCGRIEGAGRDFQTHRHRLIEQNRAEEQDCAEYLVPRNHLKKSQRNFKPLDDEAGERFSLFFFYLFSRATSDYRVKNFLSRRLSLSLSLWASSRRDRFSTGTDTFQVWDATRLFAGEFAVTSAYLFEKVWSPLVRSVVPRGDHLSSRVSCCFALSRTALTDAWHSARFAPRFWL